MMSFYQNNKLHHYLKHKMTKQSDPVKHPKHYTNGIEMWDYAYSHGLDFFEGNILKYITRWKDKNGIQDLYKAKAYLDRLIEQIEKSGKK